MKVIYAISFLTLIVQTCQSAKQQRFMETYYLPENHALLNHVIHWQFVSSPVICGRDCSMNPNCGSFNYHIKHDVCVMNTASRAHSPGDFVGLPGSAYYDDNVNISSYPETND